MSLRATLIAGAVLFAAVSALPFAGGWNDASRLAAAESLAERGTWVIDDSVFVRVPPVIPGKPHPYPDHPPGLRLVGTLDKLLIDGHYYSDKSPVPSLLLAGPYRLWLLAGGPGMADEPRLLIRLLTFLAAGLAYVAAVIGVLRLGELAGLTGRTLRLFVISFGLATVAASYSRHVNNHILLLGAVAWVCVELQKLLSEEKPRGGRPWAFARMGGLSGFAYTVDLGAGPPLLIAVGTFILWRTRRLIPALVFALAALPWVALHHWLNYRIGGTFGPANAVPAYLAWPGSPFSAETMTGGLKHTPGNFVVYSLELLFGKVGIVSNNLPLWLAFAGGFRVWRCREERPVLLFAAGWCGIVWLLYSATSNNYSGQNVSVRWFVPFLAPGFWVLSRLLARESRYAADLAWLSAVGSVLAAVQWLTGPWSGRMVPGLWGWFALAGVGWAVITRRHYRRPAAETGRAGAAKYRAG